VLGDERLELGHEQLVVAACELGLDAGLDGGQPELLQTRNLGRGEGSVDACECGAAPELKSGRRRLPQQFVEAGQVELSRLDAQAVAVTDGLDPLRPEQSTEAVDSHLERVAHARGRLLAPERVDQALAPDDLVHVQQQEGEQGALARAADGQYRAVALDLERPEQAELEPRPPVPGHVVSVP
jgi:hypothetical protein